MGELIQLDAGRKVEKWTIEKKLGEGAFGAVYKVTDGKGQYALKVEGASEPIQLLKMEVYVLTELAKHGGRHFCKIEDKGRVDNFWFVVMTLVGRSLQDLRNSAPDKKFTYGTALSVAIQCLEALEDMHNIGYLHRDVKPGNFCIGRAELNELRKVYVLDFGMARKFVHDDGTIKNPRAVAGFRGTVKYAPVSCHMQRELCRQDDLETWFYMIVEFTKGSLPWRNKTEIDEIGRWKKSCRQKLQMKQLLGGCPREYIDILKVIDTGGFFATPDYPACYRLLRQAIRATGVPEFPFDWERWEEERKQREEKEKKESEKRTKEKGGEKQKDVDKTAKKDDDKTQKKDEDKTAMEGEKPDKEDPPKK